MQYVAVEILPNETPHELVKFVLETANSKGCRIAQLELMGYVELGRQRFIRFRHSPSTTLLGAIKLMRRTLIYQEGEKYIHSETRREVSSLLLHSVADRQVRREYRGTSVKFWERQFLV